MEEIIRIFKEIQETSSLNDKKFIIAANQDNHLFKECLKFLLDGTIVTGISEKKLKKDLSQMSIYNSIPTWQACMKYLKMNNTGRDIDIKEVQSFINKQPEDHMEFYKLMVTKKYRLGADAKLVNKVIPDLIPTFNLMLGTPIEKCKLQGDELIFISQKLNGTRCSYTNSKLMTRQGKEYTGLDHIIADLHTLGLDDYFIDGELRYKNKEGLSDSDAFQKGTGIANSKSADKSELKLIIFDMFPIDEFWNGKSNKTYKELKKNLLELKKQLDNYENLEIVQSPYEGTNHTEIWKWLEYAEKNDWEGIMINLDTPYECKRTKNLIKVKRFFSCDVECIGMERGSGRNKDTLGALIVDYKGNTVNVGSGFSDEQRNYYWNNPEQVIGKIISVKFKEETRNKDGGISIQFPVFESVRFDKDEPSYN